MKSYYVKMTEMFNDLEIDYSPFFCVSPFILPLDNFILVMEVDNGPKMHFFASFMFKQQVPYFWINKIDSIWINHKGKLLSFALHIVDIVNNFKER